MKPYKYVIITPAYNEEKFIEKTIKSVINQTVLPVKWIIINDSSTDCTEDIIRRYEAEFEFIEVFSTDKSDDRNFSSKVNAFNTGYNRVKGLSYQFIGNLDADVSFEPTYFEEILKKFENDPKLGLAGGIILESIGHSFIRQNTSLNSVAGAVQLFRRSCFEEIGGYIPLYFGGIDAAAEIMTRMKGWQVRTFEEVEVFHHRRVAKGKGNLIRGRFNQGVMFYLLGYHPVFFCFSCLSRIFDRPFLIGSIIKLIGFFWSFSKKMKRPVSDEFVKYLQKEQIDRMKEKLIFFNFIGKRN